ncbi:MAG: O-antigen ligase family protein, partial [Armatimonadetes bacterium]|nr:O-antigen ligase family protein [Armatimonadota bacterium]
MSAVLLLGALVLSPVIGGGFGELTCAIIQILVFAALICRLASKASDAWARVPGFAFLMVFLALVCVSTVFTESVYASLRFLIYATACVGAYVLAGSICRNRRIAACAVWGLTLVALGICLFGIRDYATSAGGGIRFWKSLLSEGDHRRLFGTFINPGFFAGFLVIAIPIALGVYLVTRRSVLVLLAGTAFALNIVALMLTGAKFGVMATAGSLVVFLVLVVATRLLTRDRLKRLILISIVLVPLVMVFSGPVRQRMRAAESGGTQVHSTLFRLYAWRSTINMIRDHPLIGLGPGTFDVAYPRYAIAGPTKYAHQSYLQIGAETGIPALAALLIALAFVVWRPIAAGVRLGGGEVPAEPAQSERRALLDQQKPTPSGDGVAWDDLIPPEAWRVVNWSLLAALFGSCLRNLVDSDWYVMGIALPFAISAGLLVGRSGAARISVSLGMG